VYEDEVTHGLDHRPLAVDAVMLAALGHGPGALGSRGPGLPQLSPSLAQVGRLIGTDQQPHRVAAVELRLDVRHHLHAVDHKVGDQTLDLNVLHDHADQTRPTQVALAELRVGEVFVVEPSHADRLSRSHRRPTDERSSPAQPTNHATTTRGNRDLTRAALKRSHMRGWTGTRVAGSVSSRLGGCQLPVPCCNTSVPIPVPRHLAPW
jgi:hypothetical protein